MLTDNRTFIYLERGCTRAASLILSIPMDYKQVVISINDPELNSIVIALLSEECYEGFEEKDDTLLAYIPSSFFQEMILKDILGQFDLRYTTSDIARTNWNKTWEESFEPVVVEDFCTVRADFHSIKVTTPYEVVITPKMSFGTGHHATTQLMISLMRKVDFLNRSVLDFGTGTGILSILSSMLGASKVVGIDNEQWAEENARENVQRNAVTNVDIKLGSIEIVEGDHFDIILANINRHILLQYMGTLNQNSATGGDILLSGLLVEDRSIIVSTAQKVGFSLQEEYVKANWIVLWFRR